MAKKSKKVLIPLDARLQEISAAMTNGFTEEQQRRITISDVRRWMNVSTLNEGKTKCPCCLSHLQTYKRTVSASLVYLLMTLYKLTKGNTRYYDLKKADHYLYERTGRNASDTTVLRYYELIEVDPDDAGMYKLTELGVNFISGLTKVPKYLYITNGKVWKKSTEMIDFHDCKKFDKQELTKLEFVGV